jgi:rhodanese-related sulfurtransferase
VYEKTDDTALHALVLPGASHISSHDRSAVVACVCAHGERGQTAQPAIRRCGSPFASGLRTDPDSGFSEYPLFAVTTKTFLQGKQVLLVDDGVRPRQLADACDRLTQAGFSVRFLFGGLAAWQASGGRMQGDAFVRNSLNRLSPQAFWAAREQADWLVIDASDSPLPASREPASSIFPSSGRSLFSATDRSNLWQRLNARWRRPPLVLNGCSC